MFRMSPSLMGNAFFHWDEGAVFAVDDFMQPAGLDAEKEFPVFHILLGNHDALVTYPLSSSFAFRSLPAC